MKLFKGWFSKRRIERDIGDEDDAEEVVINSGTVDVIDSDNLDGEDTFLIDTKEDIIDEAINEVHTEKEEEINYWELPDYDPLTDLEGYKSPSLDLLEDYNEVDKEEQELEVERSKNKIVSTLESYGVCINSIAASVGPSITLFEIVPPQGVRIAKIINLKDEIALALSAVNVNIKTIPGKGMIGIEVSKTKRSILGLKQLLSSEEFSQSSYRLPIVLGKKTDNENFIGDLSEFPHLLVCGSTGQGKSACVDAIVSSLLFKKHPSELKFIFINPNGIQLKPYGYIDKHFLAKLPGSEDAIITNSNDVISTLNSLCIEMDNRYDLLKEAHARSLIEYNQKFIGRKLNPKNGHTYLPFLVLIFDAFQEPEITSMQEVSSPLSRLVNLGRQVGIHAIIATERPTSNILPADITANCTVRIAFKVPSSRDSNIILGSSGAENLMGDGDMLISYYGQLIHAQGAFINTEEVDRVVEFISNQRGYKQAYSLPEYIDEREMDVKDFDAADLDPLFEDAAKLIVQNQIASTSLLQRRMKLGYNRTGRLMDQLEAAGVVGPNQGSKAREVFIKTERELREYLDTLF